MTAVELARTANALAANVDFMFALEKRGEVVENSGLYLWQGKSWGNMCYADAVRLLCCCLPGDDEIRNSIPGEKLRLYNKDMQVSVAEPHSQRCISQRRKG